MNKIIKIIIVLIIISSTISINVFAGYQLTGKSFKPNIPSTTEPGVNKVVKIAGKILGLIRSISAASLVIIIAYLGLKYMMGSVEQRADYKKSFIPLIIGTAIVLFSSSLAIFIWNF